MALRKYVYSASSATDTKTIYIINRIKLVSTGIVAIQPRYLLISHGFSITIDSVKFTWGGLSNVQSAAVDNFATRINALTQRVWRVLLR